MIEMDGTQCSRIAGIFAKAADEGAVIHLAPVRASSTHNGVEQSEIQTYNIIRRFDGRSVWNCRDDSLQGCIKGLRMFKRVVQETVR